MDSFCSAIAAQASSMSQTQVKMQVQTSVIKGAMEMQSVLSSELLASMESATAKVMEMSVAPNLGVGVDISA